MALVPFLAACVSSGATSPGPSAGSSTGTRQAIRPPSRGGPREPTFQQLPGLEGVIGATQSQLVRQFGPPRLDVWEGDARKLQFTGSACLLDIYLYPTSQSKEPLAAWVDARRTSDGRDVDRASCVAALRPAQPPVQPVAPQKR